MDLRRLGLGVGKFVDKSVLADAHTYLRKTLEFKKLAHQVSRIVDKTPVADIHTHLFSKDFGDLLLWGIDELLTYHYLVAELFRYKPELDYQTFWDMPVDRKAELIWDEMFVKHSPLSEAARGVVTVLNKLGIELHDKNLHRIRRYFAEMSPSQYIDKVFDCANVSYVVMTNDPFNAKEQALWNNGGNTDARFKPALRLDTLLNDFPRCLAEINRQGFPVTGRQINEAAIDAVKNFLKSWIEKIQPVYMAVSLPPDFRLDDSSARSKLIFQAVLPVAREHNLPFAMMIGVKKGQNPQLRVAGDSVGKADIDVVARLARDYPEVKFLVTMLSRENQHELCVTARKFKNLMIFGCWWFLNNPSIIREITTERIETLGLTMIPQHSDARVLDQLIYKWSHSRQIIAEVLAEQYFALSQAGWAVEKQKIQTDVRRLLSGELLF